MRREPPFTDVTVLTVSGSNEEFVRRSCMQLRDGLCAAMMQPEYRDMGLEVLGPAPAPVVKVNGRFRYRITVVGRCSGPVRRLLAAFMKDFAQRSENRNMSIFAEYNRMN